MLSLHNILPVLLLPTGLTFLVVVLGLLLRTKALCWVGLVVLWLASTSLVGNTAMRAAEGWQVRVPIAALPSSQAIVVLSGMRVAPPGDAPLGEWSEAGARFEAGITLFQAGKAPVLVCTGPQTRREDWLPRRARPSAYGSAATRHGPLAESLHGHKTGVVKRPGGARSDS